MSKPTFKASFALILLSCALCSSCQQADTSREKWPGPCRAQWSVYETLDIAGKQLATPVQQGKAALFYFSYNPQGFLTQIEQDQDGDGSPENRTTLYYGSDGQLLREELDNGPNEHVDLMRTFHYQNGQLESYTEQTDHRVTTIQTDNFEHMGRIWDQCQGKCVYDEKGNLLLDKDPGGQDVLSYNYECWTSKIEN